jgi:N12 class adenine-specific DNA methylase
MRKSKKVTVPAVDQMSFDFGFAETVAAVDRIQADAEQGETDVYVHNDREGNENVDARSTTAGRSKEDTAGIDAGSGLSAPVHGPGLENSGPLGDVLSGNVSEPGAGRGVDAPGTLAGSATSRGADSPDPGSAGSTGVGNDGKRTAAAVRTENRTLASDYVITDADRLGQGGAKTKYKDNIAALRLLKVLEDENRPATTDEQGVLVRYVGWGGIPQAFDHRNADWEREFAELAALLPKDQYEAARRSTQDAHYTAKPVVEAIYQGLQRIGFNGGNVGEPSVGSGNFLGLMPEAIRKESRITGIELDPVTAGIAKHLYPSATIINKGFQEITIPSGYFDAVIGNPPFGNQRVYDQRHPELSKLSIHNYFIAKSLDKVRDGGLVAVVVSSYFLDAGNSTAREMVSEKARLLGAIRLPNTAFKANALTEVTTDIVFLQKLGEGEEADRSWVNVGTINDDATGEDIPLNQYYLNNPHMLLGRMALEGTQYRNGQPALLPIEGQDLPVALAKAIQQLPSGVFQDRGKVEEAPRIDEQVDVPDNVKVGAYFVAPSGRIARRVPDLLDDRSFEWVTAKNDKAAERIRGLVEVRDALRQLMAAERSEHVQEAACEQLRARLNRYYDSFVKKHGHIGAQANRQAMQEDPEYPLLHALERDYDKGITKETARKHGVEPRAASAKKAAIFTRRVMTPHRVLSNVESAKDALVVSMNETGRVDVDLMVRLTGKQEDEILRELTGLIYANPANPPQRRWETTDQYLTGNVKLKLQVAEVAAGIDMRYAANVDALRLVQPADIDPVDIAVQLGSPWVSEKYVSQFVAHLLGEATRRDVTYLPSLGKWTCRIGRGDDTASTVRWGTKEAPANWLLECILTNRPVQVKDPVGKDDHGNIIYAVNEEATAAAVQKADEIRQAFGDWIWEDKDRRETLARIYNDRFNTHVAPRYDGSHLSLPGASVAISLRPHQKNVVWRGVQDGTVLLDHRVGAGKTIACCAIAMESKRMGLLKKPMFVVPNHLLLQWKDDFYALYPNANILVAEKSDFTKENRERLFARIATGDWDAVIVAHSSFKKIGMPEDTLNEILNEQIDDITMAVERMREERGNPMSIKEMEKARDRMQEKVQRMAETGTKDKAVSFADLGVDGLFVDEAHEFKNLAITTSLSRISGLGNLAGSDKAFDMFVKVRYLQKQNEGRGVFFATGTPISNTIAELYTVQRYLQYDALKEKGIHHFDAWASTFGQVVTGWELDATGVNYKLNSRFAKFQNVPELVSMYRTFADVIGKEDLDRQAAEQGKRFPVPKVKGGKPRNVIVERSPMQADYMGVQQVVRDDQGLPVVRADGLEVREWNEGSIIHRMENLPKDPRIDNPLKITNDARKAGLDFRLVDPDAEDFEGSKTNESVREIVRIWSQWNARKGTQLVFCDLSTPKAGGAREAPVIEQEEGAEKEDPVAVSMDELLAGDARFSVYDDLRRKLVAQGIPAEEIRFIHEAKTDLQKQKLFGQMNRGEVRVLIGSTAKMGAGMNAQRKLVGLHHLDAPWRPSDLEQREGRILRQGNEFYEEDPDGFEVEILRYSTKQTYDARMWQTIEYKAGGIEQFRRGDSLVRVIDDVAGEAANAAEMKAAATGNPLIFLQVQLTAERKKYEALYANHQRNQHMMERRIDWLNRAEERERDAVSMVQAEILRRDANTTEEWEFRGNGGRMFNNDSKGELLALVAGEMKAAVEKARATKLERPAPTKIGKYRGFEVLVVVQQGYVCFGLQGGQTYFPGNLTYGKDDNFSLQGWLQRMDNQLGYFESRIGDARSVTKRESVELSNMREEFGKPFPQMAYLEALRQDVGDVMVELKLKQKDDNYVSTWEPSSVKMTVTAKPNEVTQSQGQGQQLIAARGEDAVSVMKPSPENLDPDLEGAAAEYPAMVERAKEAGFSVRDANTARGIYSGPIINAGQHYVVQDAGMRTAVIHSREHVGTAIAVGEHVRATYSAGICAITRRDAPSLTR